MSMKYDHKAVGTRIRRRREELHITQAAMAERCEMSTKYYADIERGTCGMSIDTLLVLCSGLHLSPSTLLLGEAVPDFDSTDISEQIMNGLVECSEEQRQCILQTIRLFTMRS